MCEKIHHPTDKAIRNMAKSYANALISRLGINLKVIKVLNTKALNSKFKDREMDCLVELEDNSLLIIEIQSSKLTKKKLFSIIDYVKYVKETYNKETNVGIIFANNMKNIEEKTLYITKQITFTPFTYSFSEENGDETLNRLKSKIKNNKILSENDKVDLALISLYSTIKTADELANEGAQLISQIKNLPQKEINKIVNPHLMIINKTVKSKKIREQIRMCLKMQQVSILQEEKEQGIEIGKEEGIEIGKEEGIEEGIIKERTATIKKLKDKGLSTNEISDLLGLTEATITSLLIL